MSPGRYTHAKNVTKQAAHVIEKRQGHEAEDANKKDAYPRRPVLQSIQFFSGVIDGWCSRRDPYRMTGPMRCITDKLPTAITCGNKHQLTA